MGYNTPIDFSNGFNQIFENLTSTQIDAMFRCVYHWQTTTSPLYFVEAPNCVIVSANQHYMAFGVLHDNIISAIPLKGAKAMAKLSFTGKFYAGGNVSTSRMVSIGLGTRAIADPSGDGTKAFCLQQIRIIFNMDWNSSTVWHMYLQVIQMLSADIAMEAYLSELTDSAYMEVISSEEIGLTFNPLLLHHYELEVYYTITPGDDNISFYDVLKVDGQIVHAAEDPTKVSDPADFRWDQGVNAMIAIISNDYNADYRVELHSLEVS